MDIVEINTVLKKIIENNTDSSFAMQESINRPRPSLPYVTFNTSSLVSIGHDSELPPNQYGNAKLVGDREFTVPIRYYGLNSIQNLEKLYSSMRKVSVVSQLDDIGLVFVGMISNINDITVLVDTKYEERAGVDFLFRIASYIVDSVGVIEKAKIGGEINNFDDTIEILIDVNN